MCEYCKVILESYLKKTEDTKIISWILRNRDTAIVIINELLETYQHILHNVSNT